MRYLSTKALIIKKYPSGENDWYLTIFSSEYGKIGALCRSSRKILSRKGCHLDPLNLCSFQLYKKNDKYWITECKTENSFIEIKNDLEKSLLAFTVLELIQRILPEEEENSKLFNLTIHTLNQLCSNKNELFLEEFKIKILKAAGSWPDLKKCSICQKYLHTNTNIMSDNNGQIYCETCQKIQSPTNPTLKFQTISFQTLKLANYLSIDEKIPQKLKLSEEILFNLKKFTAIFVEQYLHHELLSEKILK